MSFVRRALHRVALLANYVAFRTNKIHAKQTNPKLKGKESVSCYNSDRRLLVSFPQQRGEPRDNSLRQAPGESHKTRTM